MSYRGRSTSPPEWTWISGNYDKNPDSEAGILENVKPSVVNDRCLFLRMSYGGVVTLAVFFSMIHSSAWKYANCCRSITASRSRRLVRLILDTPARREGPGARLPISVNASGGVSDSQSRQFFVKEAKNLLCSFSKSQ
jgi:hypothetical protein